METCWMQRLLLLATTVVQILAINTPFWSADAAEALKRVQYAAYAAFLRAFNKNPSDTVSTILQNIPDPDQATAAVWTPAMAEILRKLAGEGMEPAQGASTADADQAETSREVNVGTGIHFGRGLSSDPRAESTRYEPQPHHPSRQMQQHSLNEAEYVIPCSRRDPEINNCLKKAFNHLRPYLARGIPELSVPPMEPFLIPRLAMENGNGPVRVRAVFSNMTIAGSNNYSIAWIKSDVSNYRIDLGMTIPKIETTGKYEVTGNVLLFPVRSRGDYYAAFYDISSISKILGREVILQDGRKYMKIERLFIDFNLSKSRFKIRDYLNSGNVIGEAMNQFLNQNADEIIKEMKPVAASTISKYLKDILNSAFLKIPMEVWLRD